MEPPHTYVRDASASVVHHGDYLNGRDGYTLCGTALGNPTRLDPAETDVAPCSACEAKLVEYHLTWWRDRAQTVTAELDALRVKYREMADLVDDHRHQPAASQHKADVTEASGAETSEGVEEPKTLLDHARRELLELCRQCDDAVPYWRLKNLMQAFSDKLSTDERVLLAQEIGTEGSLIRWCTTEIVKYGHSVTNNPVQVESEATWDAWTQDSYQTPKKTKWRLGRSHNGS
ncbi:hypothetical protein [Mycobacterium deserti]|uniref:Uncharacterized protein n=1 Tax=Mycobacterium deserti TaxID=2978347 RepID=A0ABT2MCZ1_9MYCO|nr:hypothetical protein [Mycobacterium deserti]MCT7659454.1 hypothetical protein [Mycobacterium deserti]